MANLVIDYRKDKVLACDNDANDFLLGFFQADYNYIHHPIENSWELPKYEFPDEVIIILPESNILSAKIGKLSKWIFDPVGMNMYRMR